MTKLAKTKGVVVRSRGKEIGCIGCLRITMGIEDEITTFPDSRRRTLVEMRKDGRERETVENGEWIDVGARDSGVVVSYSSPSSSSIDQATEDKKYKEADGVVVY